MQAMQLQDDLPEVEYLDGRAYRKLSAKTRHSLVQAALVRIIHDCAAGRGAAGAEWRFYPGQQDAQPTSFVPDVSFVSRDRLTALAADERQEPPFSPDIAAEVRSPCDDLRFLEQKIARYLTTGAVLVLDVDPEERVVHAHSAVGARHYAAGQRFAHSAEPWLQFELNSLFAELAEFGL